MSFAHPSAVPPGRWTHGTSRAHSPGRITVRHLSRHGRARARRLFARRIQDDTDIDWTAAGWAGIAAGAAFILVETALAAIFTGDALTDAARRVAAIALGETALPEKNAFTGVVFLAASSVHLMLSLIYARVLALFIHGMRLGTAVAFGAGFGAALYAVNFYAFTALFPWFEISRGWIALLAHLAFGVTAAGLYGALTASPRRGAAGPLII